MSRPIRNRYKPRERIQLDVDVSACVLNLNQHLQAFREFSASDDREAFLRTQGEDARKDMHVHQIIAVGLDTAVGCLGVGGSQLKQRSMPRRTHLSSSGCSH